MRLFDSNLSKSILQDRRKRSWVFLGLVIYCGLFPLIWEAIDSLIIKKLSWDERWIETLILVEILLVICALIALMQQQDTNPIKGSDGWEQDRLPNRRSMLIKLWAVVWRLIIMELALSIIPLLTKENLTSELATLFLMGLTASFLTLFIQAHLGNLIASFIVSAIAFPLLLWSIYTRNFALIPEITDSPLIMAAAYTIIGILFIFTGQDGQSSNHPRLKPIIYLFLWLASLIELFAIGLNSNWHEFVFIVFGA